MGKPFAGPTGQPLCDLFPDQTPLLGFLGDDQNNADYSLYSVEGLGGDLSSGGAYEHG